MILHGPFVISPRLLPALRVEKAWIHLEYATEPGTDGRTRYRWTIDLPDGSSFTGDDLQSGVGGGTLQEGFVSLLSFLRAAGESYMTGGENADLFPPPVVEWAYQYDLDLSLLACEIEEGKKTYIEE